jgi:neurotransmitter:Na+ symporter, NSS family
MARVSWGSRIGFVVAVAGSAVGLANIWRFPYIVGQNGGSAFIILYLLCLFLIGFPVFIAEILIGRTTQTSPSGAFQQLGNSLKWSWAGKLTVVTGFIVSSFYSAVAAWILGYLIEALTGQLTNFQEIAQPAHHYESLVSHPFWGLGFHFLFLLICTSVLYLGVRNGIEKGNKIMMPLLFVVLVVIMIKGLTMDNSQAALRFLFKPDWSALTPHAFLIALGQSFFTLSLGQGTMITYGSYIGNKDNLLKSCIPVVLVDTLISIFAAVAVFTIVFSAGLKPDQGPGLIFQTLPFVFSQISGGYILAVMFFLLVFLAALTSEISAMEPAIAYLIDEWGWGRSKAVLVVGISVFLLGIPCALSFNVLKDYTLYGENFFDVISYVASNILIPLGGFLAVIMIGWIWGTKNALKALKSGASDLFDKFPLLGNYFWFSFKYSAPILIIIVFLHSLGVFS